MSELQLFDLDAERGVIGAALQGDLAQLTPQHFHDRRHRLIWQAILDRDRQAKVIEIEPLAKQLEGVDYGGPAYLTQCIVGGSTLMVEDHTERLVELFYKREILSTIQEAAKHLKDEPLDVIISGLYEGMGTIHMGSSRADQISASKVVDEFLDRVEDPTPVWGMRTGFSTLDMRMGGLHKGEVFMLAGEPAVGKSMLAAQVGFQLAGVDFLPLQVCDTHAGAMYQMEMSEEAVIRRACCAKSKVAYNKVRTGLDLTEDEQRKFLQAAETIERAPVHISDATDWTTTSLRADVQRLIREQEIEWVLIDYAGLLKDDAETEVSREVKISKALHDIAKLGVAVIAVETLNKQGLQRKSGKVQASVRGSVQKVYDADVIAFLQYPKDAAEGTDERSLRFVKAREMDSYLGINLRMVGSEKRFEL